MVWIFEFRYKDIKYIIAAIYLLFSSIHSYDFKEMDILEIIRVTKLNSLCKNGFLMLFIWIQILPGLTTAQSQNLEVQVSSIIDSTQYIYGPNDLLINGHVYYQPNRMASGTPFLFSPEFYKGKVFTRGASFDVDGLNYNIVSQELIILNVTSEGFKLHIKLSNILVDSFLLNNYLFVVPSLLKISSNYPYMLVTNKGENYFLIGYNKEFINRFSQSNPYGKFSSTKKSLFMVYDGNLVSINSKKTFLEYFSSAKKEISTFLKKNKTKLSKATPEQLQQLMDFCNNQLTKADE